MEAKTEQDPFVSITKLCQPTVSQEAKLPNSPFARESDNFADTNSDQFSSSPDSTPSEPAGIVMVSPPDSISSAPQQAEDEVVFHTPPEHHLPSYFSAEDQNLDELSSDGVRIVHVWGQSDRSKNARVFEGELDDEFESEKIRVPGEEFGGETIPAAETEAVVDEIEEADDVIVSDSMDSGEEMADDSVDMISVGKFDVVLETGGFSKDGVPKVNGSIDGNHRLKRKYESMEDNIEVNKGKMPHENSHFTGSLDSDDKSKVETIKLKCDLGNGCTEMSHESSVDKVMKDGKIPNNGGDGDRFEKIDEFRYATGGDSQKSRRWKERTGRAGSGGGGSGVVFGRRRQLPVSLEGKGKNVGNENAMESKSGLLDFLDVVKVVVVGDRDIGGGSCEDVFPNPYIFSIPKHHIISMAPRNDEGTSRPAKGTKKMSKPAKSQWTTVQEPPQDCNPVLRRDEIIALRASILLDNVKWAKAKGNAALLSKPPTIGTWLKFLHEFAETFYYDPLIVNKKVAHTKICRFDLFGDKYPTVREMFRVQDWLSLWEDPYFLYDDDIVKLFYSNMWIEYDRNKTPTVLNSFVKGRHFHWTPEQICEILGVNDEGFEKFACTRWDSRRQGVSEEEMKTFLGLWPAGSTQSMPEELRITSLIVSFCICGKEGKVPSNLDYFITYKLKRREPLSLGAIIIQCLIESVTLGNKQFTLGNHICRLLVASGLPDTEMNLVQHKDYFDEDNINQMVRMRRHMTIKPTKSARGSKARASTSQVPDDDHDPFGDREAGFLGEGGPHSDPKGNTGVGGGSDDDKPEEEEQNVQQRLENLETDVSLHNERILTLQQKNDVLKKENTKLSKKMGKLKKFIKELLPTAFFSSDEERG